MSDVKYPDTPDRIKPYTEVDRLHDKIKQLEAENKRLLQVIEEMHKEALEDT